jgi:hypothetical protein
LLYTESQKKAGEILRLGLSSTCKGGDLGPGLGGRAGTLGIASFDQGNDMGRTDKKYKLLRKEERKPKKAPPKPADDDEEDGDIATPKRDRNDEDDQSR